MKKHHLKFLPLMAAVLLATSCSKDDENNAPTNGRDGVHTVSTFGIPFSIKVNTGNSLKKIGYAPDGINAGQYNISFTEDDEKKLEMKVYKGNNLLTILYLDNASTGEFTGTVATEPLATDDLTAEITIGDDQSPTFSNKSLEDLLIKCAHTFKSKVFHYGDKEIDLTDQNAYLAISMSPFCKHEIKINTTDYTVQDGRIWIAVPASASVESTGLGTEIKKGAGELASSKVYTVARQYFTVSAQKEVEVEGEVEIIPGKRVYFSKGNLQYNASENPKWRFAPTQYSICHTTGDNVGDKYSNWKDADSNYKWTDLFGWGTWAENGIAPISTDNVGSNYTAVLYGSFKNVCDDLIKALGADWSTLSKDEWVYLLGDYWDNTTPCRKDAKALRATKTVNNVFGLVILPDGATADIANDTWETLESAGAVFLPAAGYRYGTNVSDVDKEGRYWSSSDKGATGTEAYRLTFRSGSVDPKDNLYRHYGCSVRLVRRLN
ncbi:MAG: hypothetical protein II939_14160 [Bacteroidales bacterium]|nr:hypothetical protein [Bacteroidales bacterium]